ncbi:MAG: hypothetical protein AVDCRST_MAG19-2931, partial [uncultured Thermomicrobiales bacterium]
GRRAARPLGQEPEEPVPRRRRAGAGGGRALQRRREDQRGRVLRRRGVGPAVRRQDRGPDRRPAHSEAAGSRRALLPGRAPV